jgi:hypothetical protein
MSEKQGLKAKITRALRKALPKADSETLTGLVPDAVKAGKAYEALVFALVCERLRKLEHCDLVLVGANKVALKSSPGPINHNYPHVDVLKNGAVIARIWTDVEFTALSCFRSQKIASLAGEYHELDIAVVRPDSQSRPLPDEVLIGVECKNTSYAKNLLREVLGVRRELSLLSAHEVTGFAHWPTARVPAHPPSCLLVFCTDANVSAYDAPGDCFGIIFEHVAL